MNFDDDLNMTDFIQIKSIFDGILPVFATTLTHFDLVAKLFFSKVDVSQKCMRNKRKTTRTNP